MEIWAIVIIGVAAAGAILWTLRFKRGYLVAPGILYVPAERALHCNPKIMLRAAGDEATEENMRTAFLVAEGSIPLYEKSLGIRIEGIVLVADTALGLKHFRGAAK